MRATARIRNHPIHPMLMVFPLSTGTLAVLTDLAFLISGDAFWLQASFWLIGAAVMSALIAALAGATDFVTIREANSSEHGRYHALLQSTGLLIFAANWAIRLFERELSGLLLFAGVVLTLIGAAIWALGAWFGADLVYKHHIGVIPESPGEEKDEQLRRAA